VRRRKRGGAARRWLARAVVLAAAGVVAVGAYVYFSLPDVRPLKTRNPSTTAFMALREQEYRSARGPVPRRRQNWAPLHAISPHLIDAVLMAEDTAFYQHDGVDYHEVWESLKVDWREKKLSRGASTITQQLAKNLYLSPERSPLRKLRELLIARRLETELSKSRILELYLNVVEWGRHLYGAEAAAEAYFGVPAREITPAQSALLAGMLINPVRYTPLAPSPRLLRRQRIVLDRMVRFGRISRQDYRIALGLESLAPSPVPEAVLDAPGDGLAEDESIDEPPVSDPAPLTELAEPPVSGPAPPIESAEPPASDPAPPIEFAEPPADLPDQPGEVQ